MAKICLDLSGLEYKHTIEKAIECKIPIHVAAKQIYQLGLAAAAGLALTTTEPIVQENAKKKATKPKSRWRKKRKRRGST